MTPYEAFNEVDIRVGEIVWVEINEKANKPAYKLWINFGGLGEKTTSAQYTKLYSPEDLIGKQVVCAVNLGSRKIAGFTSEVLMLGVDRQPGEVVFLTTERNVTAGSKIF